MPDLSLIPPIAPAGPAGLIPPPSTHSLHWAIGPQRPRIEPGIVHVWSIWTPDHAGSAGPGSRLSREELTRAARFRFAADRQRYCAARSALRELVGRYLGCDPSEVALRLGPHGKPALEGRPDFQFNVSHSGAVALIAITQGLPVGVDVEMVEEIPEMKALAGRSFSRSELLRLMRLPPSMRLDAFYRCWTRKEAVIKATGEGLARSLRSFDVSLRPGQRAQVLRFEGDPTAGEWSMSGLRPAPGYEAAVAVPGAIRGLQCWRWTDDPPE